MKASPSTMATSVKILSLNVRFGNHTDGKMVLSFLGCFPNLKALHITIFFFPFHVLLTFIANSICSSRFCSLQMVWFKLLIN